MGNKTEPEPTLTPITSLTVSRDGTVTLTTNIGSVFMKTIDERTTRWFHSGDIEAQHKGFGYATKKVAAESLAKSLTKSADVTP